MVHWALFATGVHVVSARQSLSDTVGIGCRGRSVVVTGAELCCAIVGQLECLEVPVAYGSYDCCERGCVSPFSAGCVWGGGGWRTSSTDRSRVTFSHSTGPRK